MSDRWNSGVKSRITGRYEHGGTHRGRVAFADGTWLPLTFSRRGAPIDFIAIDGERYERVEPSESAEMGADKGKADISAQTALERP